MQYSSAKANGKMNKKFEHGRMRKDEFCWSQSAWLSTSSAPYRASESVHRRKWNWNVNGEMMPIFILPLVRSLLLHAQEKFIEFSWSLYYLYPFAWPIASSHIDKNDQHNNVLANSLKLMLVVVPHNGMLLRLRFRRHHHHHHHTFRPS